MLRQLAFALVMILLSHVEIVAAQTAPVAQDTVHRDRCAHVISNIEIYRSCQAGFHNQDSIKLEIIRSNAQRSKERQLGLPILGVFAVLTVIALLLSRTLEARARVRVIVALMLVLVAAVLAIFNTEAASAFGAAITAAAAGLLAAKAQ